MKPVLKWVGGKTQLLPEIIKRLPMEYNRYFEPFIGGGAVLFSVQPHNAVINDYNKELTNLYQVIKSSPEPLIKDLKKHKNESAYFYELRSIDRNKDAYKKLSVIKKASRVIYLNKTCYNGLYRVNLKGEYNAPFGKYKNPLICDEQNIRELSEYFNNSNITIINGDFEKAVESAKAGDFVYFDPPYDPLTPTASFTSYNANGFSRNEQVRLKQLCDSLTQRGVKWMQSNSATEFVKNLYLGYNVDIVKAKRFINSKGDGRGAIDEVIITNYEQ